MDSSKTTLGFSKHRQAQHHSKYGVAHPRTILARLREVRNGESIRKALKQSKRKLQNWTDSIENLLKGKP